MIRIVTAMHWEAKPLIRHFGLKRDLTLTSHELFRSDKLELIVSTQIGRLPAAIATTLLLANADVERTCLFNIGVCGGAHQEIQGALFVAHKVHDRPSQRRFYPDLFFRHELPERPVESFDTPVTSTEQLGDSRALADMEAGAVFEAASKFLQTHQIFSLKIVSDRLRSHALSEEKVARLMEPHLAAIEAFTSAAYSAMLPGPAPIGGEVRTLLTQLSLNLQLTSAQKRSLQDAASYYLLRGAGDLTCLNPFLAARAETKLEGKRVLHDIMQRLYEEVRSPGLGVGDSGHDPASRG